MATLECEHGFRFGGIRLKANVFFLVIVCIRKIFFLGEAEMALLHQDLLPRCLTHAMDESQQLQRLACVPVAGLVLNSTSSSRERSRCTFFTLELASPIAMSAGPEHLDVPSVDRHEASSELLTPWLEENIVTEVTQPVLIVPSSRQLVMS
jgi:hypothetical protein